MKKILIPFIALVLALATASCIGNDEPTNSFTQVVKMYNRAIGDNIDGCLFSTSTTQIAIDMNAATISLSTSARINDRQRPSFKVEVLKMTTQSAGLYTFSASNVKCDNGSVVTNLQGTFDMNAGVMYLQYLVDGETTVYSTSLLAYAYTNLSSSKDGGVPQTFSNSMMIFRLDSKDSTKATLEVRNLQLSATDPGVDAATYDTVSVKVTDDGYMLTADRLKSNTYGSTYDMTDFNGVVSNQGRVLNVTFKCKGYDVKYHGSMFKED